MYVCMYVYMHVFVRDQPDGRTREAEIWDTGVTLVRK